MHTQLMHETNSLITPKIEVDKPNYNSQKSYRELTSGCEGKL